MAAFRYSMKPEPETEWSKTGSINLLMTKTCAIAGEIASSPSAEVSKRQRDFSRALPVIGAARLRIYVLLALISFFLF